MKKKKILSLILCLSLFCSLIVPASSAYADQPGDSGMQVIVAFQTQLDSLFESDVVDITADIQVMERMMAAEGLTGEKIPVDR